MADYREIKHWFYIGFGAVGIGSCIFLRDFLAVRGLAVFMLLLAKLMLDTQRNYMLVAPEAYMSEWRLVFAVWAYMIIVMSMWLVISPWRMRDMIEWMLAKPGRLVVKGWFRLGFGILLIVLGLTVFGIPDAAAESEGLGLIRWAARCHFIPIITVKSKISIELPGRTLGQALGLAITLVRSERWPLPLGQAQQVPVDERTLSNGMKLLMLERHHSPAIAGGWVARVGSVNERPRYHRHRSSL